VPPFRLVERLREEAELSLTELACWFLLHNFTIILAFWAGVSYGKRVEIVSRSETIQEVSEGVFGEGGS